MASKSSSGVGSTIVTIIVVLIGGYVGLVLFSKISTANAASQQQQNGLLSSLLKALKGGSSSKGSAGSGSSGSKGNPFSGLSSAASSVIATIRQAISDGQSMISQLNTGTDNTSLPLIGSESLGNAWDVLGNDFGFDQSAFQAPPSTDNSTDYAGTIPYEGGSSTWDVALDPSAFGNAGGDGGSQATFDEYSPSEFEDF